MAITFSKRTKIQKYLIGVFIVILVIIALIFSQRFFKKPVPPSSEVSFHPEKIEINFDVFKNPLLIELQPFEELALFPNLAKDVSLTPTLSWQAVPEAEIYLWEVIGVESSQTKETSVKITTKLSPSTLYVWRVKACKEDTSECSSWSSQSFTTARGLSSPESSSFPAEELLLGRENPFIPY